MGLYRYIQVQFFLLYRKVLLSEHYTEIKQLGGVFGKNEYVFEYAVDIKKDKTYIFFLETNDNLPASLLKPYSSNL